VLTKQISLLGTLNSTFKRILQRSNLLSVPVNMLEINNKKDRVINVASLCLISYLLFYTIYINSIKYELGYCIRVVSGF